MRPRLDPFDHVTAVRCRRRPGAVGDTDADPLDGVARRAHHPARHRAARRWAPPKRRSARSSPRAGRRSPPPPTTPTRPRARRGARAGSGRDADSRRTRNSDSVRTLSRAEHFAPGGRGIAVGHIVGARRPLAEQSGMAPTCYDCTVTGPATSPDGRRRVSLTFDNGPSVGGDRGGAPDARRPGPPGHVLRVGDRIARPEGRELAEQAHAAGHWIGNHTLTHTVQFGGAPDAVVVRPRDRRDRGAARASSPTPTGCSGRTAPAA